MLVNLNEYDIVEEEKNSKEVNPIEYDIIGEENNLKDVNSNKYVITEKENNFKKVSPNKYEVAEEKNNLKINTNEYDIVEEEKNSEEVNINEYDIAEKEKTLINQRKIIGCDIYKEFEGVKSLGTVTTYMTSLELFEVMYKNDSRMEYLNYNEVLSHLVEKDKIYEVQLVEPSRNSLHKRIETEIEEMEEAGLGEEVTSKWKMDDNSIIQEKSSSKKGKFSSISSLNKAINIEQTEVTLPPKENNKRKKNENSKSTRKFTKKEPEKKRIPWHAKRKNATEEEPYEPYQFRGLYICKELNGIRLLGTVIGYCPEKNKLIVCSSLTSSL
ncbi:uncharacterized protein LOC131649654 [Vicia villosa]|uniref:uncharacterized protein LOC131649654 n=1 Tax=Vicia villosa TaxID=3911 RepID=UPI00273BE36B|nr:uncharacterized protein LOC131649654 [Vicia villosa]